MKIYGFSGLGADERVFHLLNDKLKKPISPIPWIAPAEEESIEQYASRISEQIEKEKEIVLVGVSFGGIIATEIAKRTTVKKIILISSIATKEEVPWYFKLTGSLNTGKLIPEKHIIPPPLVANWFFSVKQTEHKELLKDILKHTDTSFAKWAVEKISTWANTSEPEGIIRIHGTHDRVLPITRKVSVKINNAGHFMIVQRADEIAGIINEILDDLQKDQQQ